MSLKVQIKESKQVSKWVEYNDTDGNVLAEFKVRGDAYQAYLSAKERASNQVSSKGFDVAEATKEDKTYIELLRDCVACHLIEDWKGIEFEDKNGEVTTPPCTQENAIKLLRMGNLGNVLWLFITNHAAEIQAEADKEHKETLGK